MLIIKKLCSFFLVMLSLFSSSPLALAQAEPDISADSAILIYEDGQVIYGKNQDKPRLIASLTKLMTGLIVLESCDLGEKVEILPEFCSAEGSSMYLEEGEEYTVEELLKGLLLVSGNDAALALADHAAGSEEEFCTLMNLRARELGLKNTHFENPHGLDSKSHYSSAADIAALMAVCMKNPVFRSLTSLKSTVIKGNTFINHNRLLKLCRGCVGGKTGYTESAGRCLVSCCEREGARFICVTLNAPDDWNDHIKLYNMAYSRYSLRDPAEKLLFKVPVISGERSHARVGAEKLQLLLPRDAVLSVRAELPYFEFAPIARGETAGWAYIYLNGEEIAGTRLFYTEPVPASAKAVKILKRRPYHA